MLWIRKLYREELFRCSLLINVPPIRSTRWVKRLSDARGRKLGNVMVWLDFDQAGLLNQLGTDVKRHAATGVY